MRSSPTDILFHFKHGDAAASANQNIWNDVEIEFVVDGFVAGDQRVDGCEHLACIAEPKAAGDGMIVEECIGNRLLARYELNIA